jgi:membrane fusion protein (multidrug efflux system)
MTYRSIVLPLGAALIFGGLLFVKSYGNKQMNAFFDKMPQPPVTVSAAHAERATWPREIQVVGSFAAVNGADLATEIGGTVEEVGFKNGAPVKAGTVILRLDTDIDMAELKSLDAAARLAEIELARVQSLYESKSISKSEVDLRQSQADQARANVAAQRARIAQKTIVAPFDGVLGIRKVNLGQYVEAGTPIVSLQSLDPIFLNFMLPEQRLDDVAVGRPVEARVDALPGKVFMGKVNAVEPQVDRATRNFMVQASFENTDHHLRPGMFAKVQLEYGEPRPVLTVPQTAISFNPYGNSVYVIHEVEHQPDMQGGQAVSSDAQALEDGKPPASGQGTHAAQPQLTVTQRFVRTGDRRGDLVAIVEGLDPGERVATSGLLKLRNDAVVNINNEVVPTAEIAPTPPNG